MLLQESRKVNQSESEPGEESDPPPTNNGQSKAMFTLNMEVVAMEKLGQALELWETLLKDQCKLDNKINHNALFSCFLLCSDILRLSRKVRLGKNIGLV